ncbi:unnamed protein product, partial [Gulo gulo]
CSTRAQWREARGWTDRQTQTGKLSPPPPIRASAATTHSQVARPASPHQGACCAQLQIASCSAPRLRHALRCCPGASVLRRASRCLSCEQPYE